MQAIKDVSTQFTKSVQFLLACFDEVRMGNIHWETIVETFSHFNQGEKVYYFKQLDTYLRLTKEQDPYMFNILWNKEGIKKCMKKLTQLVEGKG